MFNKSGFNLTKFNAASGGRSDINAAATIALNAAATINAKYAVLTLKATADLIHSRTPLVSTVSVLHQPIELNVSANVMLINRMNLGTVSASISSDSTAESLSKFGIQKISLENLILSPGDELRIDTEAMTVTVNGSNAVKYFTKASEFFGLRPGENVVSYEDKSGTRKALLKILWKDRWL